MKTLVLTFCYFTLILNISLNGQSISWGPTNPAGIANQLTVYSGSTTSTFEFTNGGTALTAGTIEVALGTGVEYVAGGFISTTSGSAVVTEMSATGDNPAIFNIGALALGESVKITFLRQATCDARTHKSGGGTFEDVCHVFESGTEVGYLNNGNSAYAASYDVIYGNLVLGAVTHSPSSATSVGGLVTRSLNVTNGSFGDVVEFWFEDAFTPSGLTTSNFQLNGVAIPAANITQAAGQTLVHFDAALITMINGAGGTTGNGDALFEKDEFFTLTYDVVPQGCGSNNTQPSALKVYYGEDASTECAPSGTTATSVSITNGTPLITITKVDNDLVDLCLTTSHSIEIKNNGTSAEDFAANIYVFMGLRANNDPISTLTNIPMWGGAYHGTRNFSNFTINGNPVTLSQIAGTRSTMVDYLPPNFLSTDPDGAGTGLEDLDGDGFYDDLGPGESFIIGFEMTFTPKTPACGKGRADYMQWEHISSDVGWQNQCGLDQIPLRTEFSYKNMIRNYQLATFMDGPSDINDGDDFEIKIKPHLHSTVGCNGGNGLTGSDVTFTVKCVLPPGVSLQSNPSIDPINQPFSPTLTQSNDTVFYTISRYHYEWFTLPLTLDCALWDGSNPLSFDYITTYKCGTCFEQDIHCENFLIVPHCPSPCVGVTTDDFNIVRTTRGWTDATMTTPVVLTEGVHATNVMLPYDTISIEAKGRIADTISDNLHLRLTYTPDIGGNILDYISGEITFYDIDGAYGNTTYTFPITVPPVVSALAGGEFEWSIDLTNYITMVDAGYEIGEGMESDSFKVDFKAVYNSNPGYAYYAVQSFRAYFYMLDDVSAERGCNSYGAPLFYTGFDYRTGGNVITLEGCNEINLRTYGTWYNTAGSVFPDEYRPIEQIDTVIVGLPDGVVVNRVEASSYSNGTASYYFDANDDLVITPNSDYSPRPWTGITYPGFDIYLEGACEFVPNTYNVPITYVRTFFNYHPDSSLHEVITTHDPTGSKITYLEPSISLTPLGQIQQGVTDTVSWELEICNSTSELGVDYSWVTFDESVSAGISIVKAADISTGTEVPITPANLTGGTYLIETGMLSGGDCKTIKLYATYNDCSQDEIIINSGWSCNQYPTTVDSLPDCSADDFLRVVPQDAQIASTITPLASTPSDPSDPTAGTHGLSTIEMCEPFPMEYTIVSSGTATIYDINFNILNPNFGLGLNYVPNSATIEVEGVDVPNVPRPFDAAAEAAMVAGTINIPIEDIDATNFGAGNGLTGAGINALKNEIVIRWLMEPDCDFISGDKISIKTFGDSPCSDPAIGNGEQIVSSALKINGVILPYNALLNTSFSPDNVFTGCADTKTVSVESQVTGGVTGTTDSLFVILPAGLAYDGSLNCTSVNCPTFVEVRTQLGQEVVVFHYPGGLVNPIFNVDFDVTSSLAAECDTTALEVKSTAQIGGLVCDNVACPSSKVITGNSLGSAVIDRPILDLVFSSVNYDPSTQLYEYVINVSNTGPDTEDSIEVNLYCLNAVGDDIEPSYGIIKTIMVPIIPNGGTEVLTGTVPNPNCSVFTGFGAVISPTSSTGDPTCMCPIDLVAIGVDVFPIELTSFSVKNESCVSVFNWSSASETDFKHYELQASPNKTDFYTIAVIDGKGSPFESSNYEYEDRQSSNLDGKMFYRLKLVDLDGSFSHSKIILLDTKNCTWNYEISIAPNPVEVGNQLNISIKTEFFDNDIQIRVLNTLGQEVLFERLVEINSPNSTIPLETNRLSAGTYFLQISEVNSSLRTTQKFIVY